MAAADEVEALYRDLLTCWNERDAAGYGGLFSEDGSLVGFDGSSVEAPAAITDHLATIFADHQTAAYVWKVRDIRPLGSGAALLRGVASMVPPGGSDINPDVNVVQAIVAVQRAGGWRVAHFQNTPAAFHGNPEAAEALTAELRAVLDAKE